MPRERLSEARINQLLDQTMEIIVANGGFSNLRMADLARRLCCSTGTLYRIAPSKESLVVSAFNRWAEKAFAESKAKAETEKTASRRARRFFREIIARRLPQANGVQTDIERYEGTRRASDDLSARIRAQMEEYFGKAIDDGEMRMIDPRLAVDGFEFMAERIMATPNLVGDGEAFRRRANEVEMVIWEGLLPR